MSRTLNAGEATLLAATVYACHVRAFIADSEGNWTDLTSINGTSWLYDVELDWDIDTPIASCTLHIRRDISSTLSLVPLRTDSTLNRDSASNFASLIDAGRDVYVQVATTAPGSAPVSSDWHTVFVGTIDRVDFAGAMMTARCRDEGAALADRWITEKKDWKWKTGRDLDQQIETVLQHGMGSDAPALVQETDPTFKVTTFSVERESTLDACLRLAQSIGWDLRYWWNESAGEFQFTLRDPDREKTSPDLTLGPSQYINVSELAIDRTNVRNSLSITYTPDGSNGRRTLTPADQPDFENAVSIARFGRRAAHFEEASDSPIDSESEARAMIVAALADLAEPVASLSVEMLPRWDVQLHDLVRFSANGVHFDTDADLAVTRIRHRFGGDAPRTTLELRGQPASGYRGWIKRARGHAGQTEAPLALRRFREKGQTLTSVTHAWETDDRVAQIWVYTKTADKGAVAEWVPTPGTAPTVRLSGDTTEYTVAFPKYGQETKVIYEPRDRNGKAGRSQMVYVRPVGLTAEIFDLKQTPAASGLFTDLSITVSDPQALGGTLTAWLNHDDPESPDPDTDPADGSITLAETPAIVGPSDSWTLIAATAAQLFDNVRVYPGVGKRIYLQFTNSQGVASNRYSFTLLSNGAIIDENGHLLPGPIADALAYAISEPNPDVGPAFPISPDLNDMFYLTTADPLWPTKAVRKLYKWDGSDWDRAATVDGGDIIADTITAGAIAAGAVTTTAIAADAVQASHLAIAVLSEIADDAGIILHGKLQSVDGARHMDLDASGSDYFLLHPKFFLTADGDASFSGDLSSDTLTSSSLQVWGGLHFVGTVDPTSTISWADLSLDPTHETASIVMDYAAGGGLTIQSSAVLELAASDVKLTGTLNLNGQVEPALAANATDLASVITLANDIKAKLVAAGLAS